MPRAGLPSGALEIGLRPENVRVVAPGAGSCDAKVMLVERLGERTLIYAELADGTAVTSEDEGNSRAKVGDPVGLAIDGASAHLFGPDGTGFHAAETAG